MSKHLVISTSVELVRIKPENIVYISSDGNYSSIMQVDGEVRTVTVQLGMIENLINTQLGTSGALSIRTGKSLFLNRYYIYYINLTRQKLIMSDAAKFSHILSASKDALKQIKELLEKED